MRWLLSILFAFLALSLFAQTNSQPIWVKVITTPDGGNVQCNAIATDGSGDAIVVGQFNNGVDFGSGLQFPNRAGFFIAKYAESGSLVWGKAFGGGGFSSAPTSVAVDSQGNIITAGFFGGIVDFGGTNVTATDPNHVGASSMFLAKYSSSGNLLWVEGFGTGNGDSGMGVAVDGSDNIVLLGQLKSGGVNFNGVTLSPPMADISSIAIVKFTPSGNGVSGHTYGSGSNGFNGVFPQGLAVDSSGNLAVTGFVQLAGGSCDLGGGTITTANPGSQSSFVVEYSPSGAYQWAKVFGGSATDSGNGIVTDPHTGNVIVTGGFTGTANFGGGSITEQAQAIYLVGYDSSGHFLWDLNYGGSQGQNFGTSLAVDSQNHLVLGGRKGSAWFVNGTFVFGVGFLVHSYTLNGNSAPVMQWARYPGHPDSNGDSLTTGIALDSSGHVDAVGWLQFGSVDFGGITEATTSNSRYGFAVQYQNTTNTVQVPHPGPITIRLGP